MTPAPTQDEDTRALLLMLAESAVTGAALARFDDAEALRGALAELVPELTDHLPTYAMAALSNDALAIAERAIAATPPSPGGGCMAECVRGVLYLLRDDARGLPLLTRLASGARDARTREAAQAFIGLAHGQGTDTVNA